ncbi:MAG: hypothetical protein GY713_03030 [Actinomycetia bacterium]|nr:hypothetical protein [Actinomycetes bacterium]
MFSGPPLLIRTLTLVLVMSLMGAACSGSDDEAEDENLDGPTPQASAPISTDEDADLGTVLTPEVADMTILADLPAGEAAVGAPISIHGDGLPEAPDVPVLEPETDGTIVLLEVDPITFLPSDSLISFDAEGEPLGQLDFPDAAFASAPGQSSLAFRAMPRAGRLDLRLDSVTGQSWWIVDPLGRTRTQYRDASNPGLSTLPTGTKRWMVTERATGGPLVTDLTGGASYELGGTAMGQLDVRPSPFTPDDEWMVLARATVTDDVFDELRVVRAEDPTETAIAWRADDGFQFVGPLLGPTGTRLATLVTATDPGSNPQLVIVDLLTGEVFSREITAGTWLPGVWIDENQLVVFDAGNEEGQPFNDAVYDVSGEEVVLVYERPEGDPVDRLVAPDASSVFYVGPSVVSQVDLESGQILQGVHPPGPPATSYPDWDGTADRQTDTTWWITSGEDVPRLWTLQNRGMSVFVSEDEEVVFDGTRSVIHERTGQAIVLNDTGQPWLVQADATQTRLDPDLDGVVSWASWAPSGTKLVITTAGDEGSLNWVIDLEGQVLAELGQGRNPIWLAG